MDTYRILSAISLLHSNFFQSLLVDGKSISFQLYFSTKGLICDTLWGSFSILSRFSANVMAY